MACGNAQNGKKFNAWNPPGENHPIAPQGRAQGPPPPPTAAKSVRELNDGITVRILCPNRGLFGPPPKISGAPRTDNHLCVSSRKRVASPLG